MLILGLLTLKSIPRPFLLCCFSWPKLRNGACRLSFLGSLLILAIYKYKQVAEKYKAEKSRVYLLLFFSLCFGWYLQRWQQIGLPPTASATSVSFHGDPALGLW